MTLAFWAGFGVASLMWLMVGALAACRQAGLCTQAEREPRVEVEVFEIGEGDRWHRTGDRWSVN